MKLQFFKYQGNGNDFIIIDNRDGHANSLDQRILEKLCHRRFGIGADGVILLNSSGSHDFYMQYYNADGRESTMCGNGGRCIAKFAVALGLNDDHVKFLAIDGEHEAVMEKNGTVSLKMNPVNEIITHGNDFILNTGSPHYVQFVENVNGLDVFKNGKEIRNGEEFVKVGINVNFVEAGKERIKVRTYERGVEDETYSCGTGVVATALASSIKLNLPKGNHELNIDSMGGPFKVSFVKSYTNHFSEIWLKGGAQFVFKGVIDLDVF